MLFFRNYVTETAGELSMKFLSVSNLFLNNIKNR